MTQESQWNYVASWVDKKTDRIKILERNAAGERRPRTLAPPYYFYVRDPEGGYESIFGDKLEKAEFEYDPNEPYLAKSLFQQARKQFPRVDLFEADIMPLKRVLMDEYYGRPAPPIHYAFLDIEVDYFGDLANAETTVAIGEVSACTIYQSWSKEYLCFAVPPKEYTGSAKEILTKVKQLIAEKKLRETAIPKIIICQSERELLMKMLDAIQEADIISGWNSEWFDIPYICKRLETHDKSGYLLSKIEHLGCRPPRMQMGMHYGREEPLYKFSGRSHLDYMRLFQKFTFEGHSSFALRNILEEEVGLGKLEYEGTLDDLYHRDFATYVAYNFRDVDGIVQLDEKFKFMALANQMAHENTVPFEAVLGTVAYVETGITNYSHNVLKRIVHTKPGSRIDNDDPVGDYSYGKIEGAIVMTPRKGLYEWIGSIDLRSEYPSTIRSMNISPEMHVGQFDGKELAWREIRAKTDMVLTLHYQTHMDRPMEEMTAAEWHNVLRERKWAITGFGTVLDQSRGMGLVPLLVTEWFNERIRLVEEKAKWTKVLQEATQTNDEAKKKEADYELLQLTKKISLNSLYGAILNEAFRFGNEELGASVTATARQITTFMIETVGEVLTGERILLNKRTYIDRTGKTVHEYTTKSDAIIYGDTDSVYFKTYGNNKEEAVETANLVAAEVNRRFPEFMREAFNCQPGFDNIIQGSRELVGIRGLFQTKKKYMIKIVDKEGFAPKPGKDIKSMGSEIKKSDTPKIIQKFLKETVNMILDGQSYESITEFVNQKRKDLLKEKIDPFSLGVAKAVNNLDKYSAEYHHPGTMRTESGKKLTVPGHARAALNYNTLIGLYDKGARTIHPGDKVLVFYVKPNEHNYKAVAIPAEASRFPKWFSEHFDVDIKANETKMIDNKLKGIFAAWGKDVPSPQSVLVNKILGF